MWRQGRDAPVDEIAASVGLYINSLPLVMRWNTGMTLGEHIAELQRELMGLNEHATQSLIELHNGQPRCFDSLFVFENYPRPAMRADQHPADVPLAPVFGLAYEKVEFPLNVVVTEVAGRTALRFEFDEARSAKIKLMKSWRSGWPNCWKSFACRLITIPKYYCVPVIQSLASMLSMSRCRKPI